MLESILAQIELETMQYFQKHESLRNSLNPYAWFSRYPVLFPRNLLELWMSTIYQTAALFLKSMPQPACRSVVCALFSRWNTTQVESCSHFAGLLLQHNRWVIADILGAEQRPPATSCTYPTQVEFILYHSQYFKVTEYFQNKLHYMHTH